jgi:prevent-host-death family protein
LEAHVATTLSSREFNQNVSRAKRASKKGPVIITDRGQPAHVILSFEEYQRLSGTRENILDMLAMPEVADIEFDPPRLTGTFFRPADFS